MQALTFGTCIVAIRTPDEIILGADSLRRIGDKLVEVCKIMRERDIVFACAGFCEAEDDKVQNKRVNISEIARDSIRLGLSIADSLGKMKRGIEAGLAGYSTHGSSDDKLELLAGLKNHGIDVIVCGVEHDVDRAKSILVALAKAEQCRYSGVARRRGRLTKRCPGVETPG